MSMRFLPALFLNVLIILSAGLFCTDAFGANITGSIVKLDGTKLSGFNIEVDEAFATDESGRKIPLLVFDHVPDTTNPKPSVTTITTGVYFVAVPDTVKDATRTKDLRVMAVTIKFSGKLDNLEDAGLVNLRNNFGSLVKTANIDVVMPKADTPHCVCPPRCFYHHQGILGRLFAR